MEGKWRTVKLATATLVYFALTIVAGYIFPHVIVNTEIAVGRVLVFLMGYALAPAIKAGVPVKLRHFMVFAFGIALLKILDALAGSSAIAGLLGRWAKGFYAIILMLLLCIILQRIPSKWLRPLEWLGNYTLELYLLHVTIRDVVRSFGLSPGNIEVYCCIIVLSLLLAPVVAKVIAFVPVKPE